MLRMVSGFWYGFFYRKCKFVRPGKRKSNSKLMKEQLKKKGNEIETTPGQKADRNFWGKRKGRY